MLVIEVIGYRSGHHTFLSLHYSYTTSNPEFSVQTKEKSLLRTYLRSKSKKFLATRVKHLYFRGIPNHCIIEVIPEDLTGCG